MFGLLFFKGGGGSEDYFFWPLPVCLEPPFPSVWEHASGDSLARLCSAGEGVWMEGDTKPGSLPVLPGDGDPPGASRGWSGPSGAARCCAAVQHPGQRPRARPLPSAQRPPLPRGNKAREKMPGLCLTGRVGQMCFLKKKELLAAAEGLCFSFLLALAEGSHRLQGMGGDRHCHRSRGSGDCSALSVTGLHYLAHANSMRSNKNQLCLRQGSSPAQPATATIHGVPRANLRSVAGAQTGIKQVSSSSSSVTLDGRETLSWGCNRPGQQTGPRGDFMQGGRAKKEGTNQPWLLAFMK